MRVKIVAKMSWPAFMNVAVQMRKALRSYCGCAIYDWTKAEPGGNILFIGTVSHLTLNFLSKFVGQSNVVFYGTTEGRSFVDESSRRIAKRIRIVAVSGFVERMLEEIGISVAGIVHHGLDMGNRSVDHQFYKALKKRFKNKEIIFTASANHSRKGLNNLLYSHHLIERESKDVYLILHSEPGGYYNVSNIAKNLKLKNLWMTNLYGKMSPNKLNAFYKLCRVYVQPSYSEGFGLPILEAFRFEKPVIAVDAPPFNEIIRQRETGILVPVSRIAWFNFENLVLFKMHMYRPEDLAHAVLELISNQQHATRMEEEIRNEKHRWSIHKLYPKLLDYFT